MEEPGWRARHDEAREIVRQELGQLKCGFAAAIRREGVAVAAYLPEYQPVEVKQCFTKIRKGNRKKQRDLFWGIRATICLGSRCSAADALGASMREALWLCIDRLCHTPVWRDAETDIPDFFTRITR